MAKSTKALSGAAKNAYLKRALRAEDGVPAELRERLTAKLSREISTLTLRTGEVRDEPVDAAPCKAATFEDEPISSPVSLQVEATEALSSFDPYSPNVVVVIRTRGREAVLAELGRIENVCDLRLLAREQQLGIPQGLGQAEEIRQAIVAAAERRIANRRAAAS